MAEQLSRLASIHGDDITLDLVYDDVALEARAVVYTNVNPTAANAVVTRESNGAQWVRTVPAESVSVREDLPHLNVTIDRGRVVGYSVTLNWPA